MDNLYYLAKAALKWNDEDFWDSSPRFLFKQMDLYSMYNKQDNKANNSKSNNKSSVETNTVKTKLRVIPKV